MNMTLSLYAVRRKDCYGIISYWDFFLDSWVAPRDFDADCMTSDWIAENFVKENGGEVVKIKASLEEIIQ